MSIGKVDKISPFRISEIFEAIERKEKKIIPKILLLFHFQWKGKFFIFQAEKKCAIKYQYIRILDGNSRQTRNYPVYKDNCTDGNWTYLINLGKIVRRVHLFRSLQNQINEIRERVGQIWPPNDDENDIIEE